MSKPSSATEQAVLARATQLADFAVAGKACTAHDCAGEPGKARDCKWGWECQAWRDARSGLMEGL